MTTDGLAEAVAAALPHLTTPPPPGTLAMASVTTEPPGGVVNMTFTDKFDSRLVWYEDHIVGSFLVVVGLASLLGNGSCLVMFWRRLRHLTAAEVLLLNLAVMHLCLAIFSYPAPTVSSFAHRWLFGNVGCQLYGFVCYTLGVATIVSMAALAVVRYLKTCTHAYSRTLTTQHMKVVLLAVYLYSLFWSLLPLLSLASSYEVEPFGTSCTLHWASTERAAQVYVLLAVVFVVVVPFVVMFWCYLEILLLVRRNHRKKMIMAMRSSHSQGRTELQVTLVSGLVCAGYLVAWLPYTVVSVFYGLLGRDSPIYVTLAPVLLAKSSCAYNPVIYIFINVRYRRQMLGILSETFRPLLCCLPVPLPPAGHAPETSQEVRLSRTCAMNKETICMEEVRPLTVARATVTSKASLSSVIETESSLVKTPSVQSPEQAQSLQQDGTVASPISDEAVGATSLRDDVQTAEASPALNSTTVFCRLYSFPGDAAGREATTSRKGPQQQGTRSSISDQQRSLGDESTGDGAGTVSMVSSLTDSDVRLGNPLRSCSLKTRTAEKRLSEHEAQPFTETSLDNTKRSPTVTDTSSEPTSPGASATTGQRPEPSST